MGNQVSTLRALVPAFRPLNTRVQFMSDPSTIQNGMTCKEWLEIIANIAAILTFSAGIGAWCYYQYGFWRKRKALEEFLKQEGDADRKLGKQGAYGFLHITRKVGLTESEILQASFKNRRINRLEKLDNDGFTEKILFQYNNGDSNQP
jgi:hypothetical protein